MAKLSISILFIISIHYVKWLSGVRILAEPVIYKPSSPYETDLNFSKDWTEECDVPCVWTGDPTGVDGVFHFLTNNWDVLHAYMSKKRAPISIGGATKDKHFLFNSDYFNRIFTASSLLAASSQIPWELKAGDYRQLRDIESNPSAVKIAVMTAYDCSSKNSRERTVLEIDQIMPIARIGKCLNNKAWPLCGEKECSHLDAIRRYAFCLAFEDRDSPGYVTGKVFDCHRAGSIPVYMGTSEVLNFVPKGSIIYAGDFGSSFDLAEYLVEVAMNESLFQSYFDWKKIPLEEEFVRRNKPFWDYRVQCRVCRYVWTVQRGLAWDRETQNFTNETGEVSFEKGLYLSDRNRYMERSRGNGRLSPRSFGILIENDSNDQKISYIYVNSFITLAGILLVLVPCLRILRIRKFSHLWLLRSK